MRSKLIGLLLFFASAACLAVTPRIAEISGRTEKFTKVEIICDSHCPIVRYAADELQRVLSKAIGKKPEIVSQSSVEALQLVLGSGPLAKEAGLDIGKLPMDGYYIRRDGKRIFLTGKDDPKADPRARKYMENYDRGTLNAAYDFLERFAGVRFYFPHECGTVIPVRGSLKLPEKINILERPDMNNRTWAVRGQGKTWNDHIRPDVHARTMLQLRFRARPYGQSNSLNCFQFLERFAKTHPEYFALMEDGKRFTDPKLQHSEQLCFESGIREEIYQDIKAYLTGKTASSRGMKKWDVNAFGPGYVTVCPQDWLYWCGCEKCRKIAAPGRKVIYQDRKEQQKVSDYIWQFTADLANRMKKEGVPGKLVQLAYMPYNLPPKCEIPDNVQVAVAVFPGIAAPDHPRMAVTEAQIAPWLKIAKGGVILRAWTGKTMARKIDFIPALKHNYIGQYFAARKHRYSGVFLDEFSDYYMFTYLNLYVFSKLAWDQGTDPAALLNEHFTLMFGKAAPLMRRFYDDLEKLWNDKILRTGEDTGLGIRFQIPGEIELWNKIYSPAKMAEYNSLFDQAEKITDGMERRRVRFIRKELFGKLLEGSRKFTAGRLSLADWKIRPGETVFLRPHRGMRNEVQTTVKAEETADSFIFRVSCEEPFMDEIKAAADQPDSPKVFDDSDVEIFLKPRNDSPRYLQFAVNSEGVPADCEHSAGDAFKAGGLAWNSGAVCKTEKSAEGWKVELNVPKKALGEYDRDGFKVNFGRRRAFKTARKAAEEYYKWSPFAGGTFHNSDNWGTLVLNGQSDGNLLKNSGFAGPSRQGYNFVAGWGVWNGRGKHEGQKVELDRKHFITAGQSLHLVNTGGNTFGVSQRVGGLKPNTRYRLSFYIRTKEVEPRRESLFSGLYVNKDRSRHLPSTYISGTHEWTRMEFEFATPSEDKLNSRAPFGITMKSPGEVWVDEIRLVEAAK